jgi:hypothetical protein
MRSKYRYFPISGVQTIGFFFFLSFLFRCNFSFDRAAQVKAKVEELQRTLANMKAREDENGFEFDICCRSSFKETV